MSLLYWVTDQPIRSAFCQQLEDSELLAWNALLMFMLLVLLSNRGVKYCSCQDQVRE